MENNLIYKFKTLKPDKKTTIGERVCHIIQIIKHKKIWCSEVNEFNDKRELNFNITYNEPKSHVEKVKTRDRRSQLFFDALKGKSRVTPEQFRHFLKKPMRLQKFAEKEIMPNLKAQLRKSVGVCCFSMLKDDEWLWKEYGGQYNGVRIEIELSNWDKFHCVDYDKKDITIDECMLASVMQHFSYTYPVFSAMLCAKTQKWINEKEIRYIKLDKINEKVDISEHKIKSLSFGYKVDPVIKKKISEICKQQNIKIEPDTEFI